MHLLDTSALIKLADELAERRLGPVRRYLSGRRNVFTSVVCVAEFLEGADDDVEARSFLADLGFTPMVVGFGVARRCAALQRQLAGRGHRLGENDAWIAATALAADLEVVGDDVAFSRVPGLRYRRV